MFKQSWRYQDDWEEPELRLLYLEGNVSRWCHKDFHQRPTLQQPQHGLLQVCEWIGKIHHAVLGTAEGGWGPKEAKVGEEAFPKAAENFKEF